PRIATTKVNAVNGDPMPSVPEMSKFWSSFETALKNVTSGRQAVNEAADTAAKRILSE
ncbi:MAG: maltose/maltodextrin ABC transporter substrate-binding protein MalE, partial [Succinivibrio sp.]